MARGLARLDRAGDLDRARKQQQLFGERGLARVRVGNDGEGAAAPHFGAEFAHGAASIATKAGGAGGAALPARHSSCSTRIGIPARTKPLHGRLRPPHDRRLDQRPTLPVVAARAARRLAAAARESRARPASGSVSPVAPASKRRSLHSKRAQHAPRRRRGARGAAAVRRAVRGQGQHRRRRPADDRRLPGLRYAPAAHAGAVEKLIAAGAVCVGKTNLDQFATGLVGTRSPYGRPSSVFAADRISGGSSSGSAVAVARGDVPFALGTDTAGSGRVPAAFNNIVGLKPTPGRVSTRGVVPACRSLDCVSVFALSVVDAARVLRLIEGAGSARRRSATSPSARRTSPSAAAHRRARAGDLLRRRRLRAGVRERGRAHAARSATTSCSVDFAPLHAVAEQLYGGPWVAERHAVIEDASRPRSRGDRADGARASSAQRAVDERHRRLPRPLRAARCAARRCARSGTASTC